jgi:hypothetical protein
MNTCGSVRSFVKLSIDYIHAFYGDEVHAVAARVRMRLSRLPARQFRNVRPNGLDLGASREINERGASDILRHAGMRAVGRKSGVDEHGSERQGG